MNPIFKSLEFIRHSPVGGGLARFWHCCAPSFKVRKTVFGLKMYFDFRDNAIWWARSADKLEKDETIFDFLNHFKGNFWDVGSNVGIVALRAAALGHRVTAFDISGKALGLLAHSAKQNGLNITTVNRAFSTRSFAYNQPKSSDTENAIVESPDGDSHSITFLEAVEKYGRPDLLKMDIEGAEMEFIQSAEFKKWIIENRIPWIVEFHSPEFKTKLWPDCQFTQLDYSHYGLNLEKLPRLSGCN